MTEIAIDRNLASKVLEVVDAGLVNGMGKPVPGQMCVEAAVCYAMGLPHSDQPTCVAPMVRGYKINLNDKSWSSEKARAKGLRRVAIAQLGSAGVVNGDLFEKEVREASHPLAVKRRNRYLQAKHEEFLALVATLQLPNVEGDKAAVLNARDAYRQTLYKIGQLVSKLENKSWHADVFDNLDNDDDLSELTECMVQVLIKMKSPGTEFLDLAPLEA